MATRVFCSLLQNHESGTGTGYCAVELMDYARTEQSYLPNSAVLVTRLFDKGDSVIEITDFAPRFRHHGRMYMPAHTAGPPDPGKPQDMPAGSSRV